MLSDFMDSVVARGAEALLPQNLSNEWLTPIAQASARFLFHASDGNMPDTDQGPLDIFEDMDGNLLLAAITEILQSRYDYPAHFQIETLPREILFESIACYALYATLETIHREHGISYPHPDPDTLLEPERIHEIEAGNPRISELLYASLRKTENPGVPEKKPI
ncbi:hypothetical protein OOT00_03585 [Desulfobotulus sp. H1]|uniref:Acyl carrier protein n=1 Tax=Desulfobotulus pelophilus TaxID=2823377 RepID=A0ABT3N6H3_9BACT|nr:hypothetical protein [Desulfobotulus pelophilus]MCW7753065.1 hypothetical protein [Desulfobotulus pelophilus]